MKKTINMIAVAAAALAFTACSGNKEENAECANEQNAENVEQQVAEDLQNGTPVEVDVEGAQVIDQPDGAQEVQTEVTMTPEQAQ